MEVTTVSPSPASPTEGDDLCETDVTSIAIHSTTLLICLCGLAGNGAVIWLLSLKIRNIGLFNLTVTDSLVLLFMVPAALLFLVEDLSCSTIVPSMYLSFLFQFSVVSYFSGLLQLILLSYLKSVYMLFELCCPNLPLRLLLVVTSVQGWAFMTSFFVIPMVTSLCPSHEQGQCRAALISMYAINLLLFVAPMVITRTIDIIRANRGSRQQQPERRDIIVSLIVLFTLLLIFCNLLQQLGYFPVSSEVFFLLNCIHSSIKPFIYFLAGSCWSPCSVGSLKLSLQRVFVEEKENTTGSDDANTDTVI